MFNAVLEYFVQTVVRCPCDGGAACCFILEIEQGGDLNKHVRPINQHQHMQNDLYTKAPTLLVTTPKLGTLCVSRVLEEHVYSSAGCLKHLRGFLCLPAYVDVLDYLCNLCNSLGQHTWIR